MKAHYNPLTKDQQTMATRYVRQQTQEYIDMNRNYIVFRFMGNICMSLNERHGFGRRRLCELVAMWMANFNQMASWKDDADDLLILNLRRIHMDELADALQGEVDKLRESEKNG